MLICTPGRRNVQDNIGNTGTIIRRNISRNDLARVSHISGGDQSTIEDNAIYVVPGLDVQMLVLSDWQGWANGAIFRNNRFYVQGTARHGHGTKHNDGTYALEPRPGGAKGIVFEGNLFAGKHVDQYEDA